jgi:hypothetical protein
MSASVRRLLRDKLRDWLPDTIPVSYGSPEGRVETEHAWVGKVAGPQRWLAFKAGSAAIARKADLTVELYVRVKAQGKFEEEADEAAEEYADLIQVGMAGDPTLGGAALAAKVTATELDSWADEDAAYSLMKLTVLVEVHLQ